MSAEDRLPAAERKRLAREQKLAQKAAEKAEKQVAVAGADGQANKAKKNDEDLDPTQVKLS
jgi:hypothetical protein